MKLTQNDKGQCGMINKIITLRKRVTETTNAVIPIKYQKYPSNTILKHVIVLDKVNKSP